MTISQLLNAYFENLTVEIINNEIQLFKNLTVIDNIYIDRVEALGRKKKKQIQECRELLNKFSIDFRPDTGLDKLTNEEQYIVALLKAYVLAPEVIILNNTVSSFGYYYYDAFSRIIRGFQEYGARIFLITNHWEDTLKFSKYVAVRADEDMFTVFTIEEIEQNPRKILFALAGDVVETEGEKNKKNAAYSAIFKGSELFAQNKELSEAMEYLTRQIAEAFSAQSCKVYFVGDNGEIFHYDSNKEDENKYLLRDDYVLQCMQRTTEQVFYTTKRNQDMGKIFRSLDPEIRVLLALPVIAIPKRVGLLAVSFDRYFTYQEEDLIFLKTNCHEIGQLVQSSQLINKSILLQEVYHRIKNNLQMIIGLIYMQKYTLKAEGIDEMPTEKAALLMDNIIGQIKSIAYVNELMTGEGYIDDKVSLEMAVENVVSLYRSDEFKISMHIENIHIPYKMTISICMLVNELICNACHHAYAEACDKVKLIDVSMKILDGKLYLSVRDNGSGIKNPDDYLKAGSTGITIIRNLLRELKGEIEVYSEEGLQVQVILPMPVKYYSKG
uniref:sensor histidine kinase n=1 Tax=Faecalicatena contorta TaxID=39482 RepID=UPI00359C5B34